MASGPDQRSPVKGSVKTLTKSHPHVEAIVHGGGQIMIGSIKPIRHAAVAHDGKKTLAMLRCKAGESLEQILHRLELAIAQAKLDGQCVDELNNPDSDKTYKF
ncbi:hypothetical protein [Limnobacter litoralis]|uniref:Uncharacterized protein n=1 Tax=Limnobacter litoralis TaxID=481366 RepID=A0ABQ5YM40_9BURK|nr:hypothetical protein [Limnobacter litoralis]GLR25184.1 hypothetical protein GCM10007875_02720 [Limnobacter litoralis]